MNNKSENPMEISPSGEIEPGVQILWQRFHEISKIPRPSGGEDRMTQYLISLAEKQGLSYELDSAGNTLIYCPATLGKEDSPISILQAHTDMVCVGPNDRNPKDHGVEIIVDESGEWMSANGTTLGADNGVGLAAALALMDDPNFEHGPLYLLATVDEETGLTGAKGLDFDENIFANAKYLFNFDSEELGEVTIGCAGGGDTVMSLPVEREPLGDYELVKLEIEGLPGGHSGVKITENIPNAIKALSERLANVIEEYPDARIVTVAGGDFRNAIPTDAYAILALPQDIIHDLDVMNDGNRQYDTMMTQRDSCRLLELLSALPHGVKEMNADVDGLAETSTNLAKISDSDEGIKIEMLTRSMNITKLRSYQEEIHVLAESFGAIVDTQEPYEGWIPDTSSEMIGIVTDSYHQLTGNEMKVGAIHAGLECGIILSKFPHLQAVSFGPTIEDAHKDTERVHIPSVSEFYALAKTCLEKIAA